MKNIYILILFFLLVNTKTFGKIWVINNSGETFVPAELTINLGDTVKFVLDLIHQVREVSQETWQSSGTTELAGGFSTPSGGGQILPIKLGPGTHYYVCVPHASGGMKGTIVVQNVTGITEEKFQSALFVFPNPAKNFINIRTDKGLYATFYTLNEFTGRQVLKGKLNDEITSLDIEKLPKGIYVLEIGDSPRQFRKIIKL
jgi:plastocyanin